MRQKSRVQICWRLGIVNCPTIGRKYSDTVQTYLLYSGPLVYLAPVRDPFRSLNTAFFTENYQVRTRCTSCRKSIQSLHESLDSFYHVHYKCYGSRSSRGTSLVKKAVHVWFCPYRPMSNPWVFTSISHDLFCTRLHEVNEPLCSQLVLCLW